MPVGLYSPDVALRPDGAYPGLERPWISWAPSHPEMALLMQLLSYANIINGLKPSEKKELWYELEGKDELPGDKEEYLCITAVPKIISKRIGKDKKVIIYGDLRESGGDLRYCPMYTCVELCPEYIDYLGKLLEKYLK